jgi:hypothetical protein
MKLLLSSAEKTPIETGDLVIVIERFAGDWSKEWTSGEAMQIALKDLDGLITITKRRAGTPKKAKKDNSTLAGMGKCLLMSAQLTAWNRPILWQRMLTQFSMTSLRMARRFGPFELARDLQFVAALQI